MDYPCSFNINLLDRSLDKYNLLNKIYENIFIGEHKPSKQLLAIKKVELDNLNEAQLENIKKDVWLTRLHSHENILPFLSCFLDHHNLWIVSPLCEYGSSSDLSKPKGLGEITIAFIIRDVLFALDYLHTRGIVHRAIRGQHILVYGPNGKCLLTGFKYSTTLMRDGKWQSFIHTYPNNAQPNLNWLSPELLEQNLLGYNCKSDIYSLGITCCELANGCVPFNDLKPTEMLLDKLTGNFPKPIDSTCVEISKLPISDMTEEERSKFESYRSRRFSDYFHAFTVNLCLLSDPHKRPTAAQLLNHNFIKQLKKQSSSTTLLSSISDLKPTSVFNINLNKVKEKEISQSNCSSDILWDFSSN